jgi:hypothetical protein
MIYKWLLYRDIKFETIYCIVCNLIAIISNLNLCLTYLGIYFWLKSAFTAFTLPLIELLNSALAVGEREKNALLLLRINAFNQ